MKIIIFLIFDYFRFQSFYYKTNKSLKILRTFQWAVRLVSFYLQSKTSEMMSNSSDLKDLKLVKWCQTVLSVKWSWTESHLTLWEICRCQPSRSDLQWMRNENIFNISNKNLNSKWKLKDIFFISQYLFSINRNFRANESVKSENKYFGI